MTTQTQATVKPKLHDTLVKTKSDWKFCRIFGRHHGEPLDIMLEPTYTGVKITSVNHRRDPVDEVYFCAHNVKSVDNITKSIRPTINDEFTFNTDNLRQIRVRAETQDAARQIEELISMLIARDSQ
ncbi:Uncharacterised protein [uncultured archaeon]|nr:Uncharacterised protein [uncultured archaeon]